MGTRIAELQAKAERLARKAAADGLPPDAGLIAKVRECVAEAAKPDWHQLALVAVAMGQCCGCSIDGFRAEDFLREHFTEAEINALRGAIAVIERDL